MLKTQTQAFFKGYKIQNQAFDTCYEYFLRKEMHKLGYVSNFSELDLEKAQDFISISNELGRLESQAMKKKR